MADSENILELPAILLEYVTGSLTIQASTPGEEAAVWKQGESSFTDIWDKR